MEPNLQDTPKIALILHLGKAQQFAWALCLLIALGPAASLAEVPSDGRPELVLQSGHTSSVHAVAFSRDGKWLASGGGDSIVGLWEANSGRLVRTLVAHGRSVVAVTFSPDGKWLASASWDHTAKVWEVASGREQLTLTGHTGNVNSLAFSPDGRWLASGGSDKTIKLWEVTTARVQQTLRSHTDSVTALAFSPDGRQLATASWDKTIKLWDVAVGQEVGTLTGHSEGVTTIAFSPDGRWLASGGGSKGGRDTTAKLWDVSSGRAIRSLVGHTRSVEAVAVSPDGRWLASGSWDGTVKMWEVATGREERTLAGRIAPLLAVAFSPDGHFLAAGSFDKSVKLWDLAGRQVLRTLAGHPSQVLSVAFSPDGRVVASGSFQNTTTLWDVATGQELRTLTGPVAPTGGYFVDAVAFSPDGRLLVSAGTDYRIRLWDAATGHELRVFAGHTASVHAVAFSPDGRWLASGSGDKTVRLWDVAAGKQLRSLTGHDAPVWTVAFGPEASTLASGSVDGLVKLWDVATGQELRGFTRQARGLARVALSPDGRWLASGGGNSIELWDVATGRQLRTMTGQVWDVTDVIFSPDGGSLASASRDGSIRLWNATTGEAIVLLTATQDGTDWVAVTPAGLFDGSEEGTQKLVAWRIKNRVYPPERFFADYYSPGLLARIFAGERPKPKIELAASKLPPEVRITSPASGSTHDQQRVPVTVEAEDQGGGVATVRLYQNGKLVSERPGKQGARSSYEFAIDLIVGENEVKVSAVSGDRVESNEDQVRLVLKAPDPGKPTLHVVAVGINQYEDPAFDLGFAKPDAASIARFFEQQSNRLFSSVRVVKLFDKDATKTNIQEALNQLQRARPEDVVLVYLAGHGVGLGQQFYFLPHEMRKEMDEEAAVRKFGMAASVLGDALRRTKALKQVLILDTCHSEAALPILAKAAFLRGLGPAGEKAVKMLARANGIYLIAASTKRQFAYEIPELGHGVLTYALLSGLGEKGIPQAPTIEHGIVTVLSLLQYINQVVPDLTERYHKGNKQYPVSSATGMDFPLMVR